MPLLPTAAPFIFSCTIKSSKMADDVGGRTGDKGDKRNSNQENDAALNETKNVYQPQFVRRSIFGAAVAQLVERAAKRYSRGWRFKSRLHMLKCPWARH